jgi:hypothetical protein
LQNQIKSKVEVNKTKVEELDDASVKKTIEQLAETLTSQGKSYAANFFSTMKYSFENINLTIESSGFDANYVKEYKSEIIEICKSITGKKIEISNTIIEAENAVMQVEVPIHALKDKEKFKILADKNHNLITLKEKFKFNFVD